MTTQPVLLMAPLSGALVPLEEVPDPVFAQKMVGDGFSIYPLSYVLRAPVEGEVVHVHDSKHAITVRSSEGLEVLMHIGLDTVAMNGEGFDVRVSPGDRVTAGDALVVFDLALVRERAASVLTQVVVTNGDLVERIEVMGGMVAEAEDVGAQVYLSDAASTAPDGAAAGTGQEPVGEFVDGERIPVPNPTGLHARPAATLVDLAKKYESDVRITTDSGSGNAKSIMAIMTLGLACGTPVRVSASGPDAEQAVRELTDAIRSGLGEEVPDHVEMTGAQGEAAGAVSSGAGATAAVLSDSSAEKSAEPPRSGDPDLLLGVSASPGVGVGHVVHVREHVVEVDEQGGDPVTERARLDEAMARAHEQLDTTRAGLVDQPDKAEIFGAHQQILEDPELLQLAYNGIESGSSAEFAWRAAYQQYADTLAGLDNEVLAGRATDVRDVGARVLEEVTGQRRSTLR